MSLWLTVTHISVLFLSLHILEKQIIDNYFINIIITVVFSKSVTQCFCMSIDMCTKSIV